MLRSMKLHQLVHERNNCRHSLNNTIIIRVSKLFCAGYAVVRSEYRPYNAEDRTNRGEPVDRADVDDAGGDEPAGGDAGRDTVDADSDPSVRMTWSYERME